MWTAQHFVVFIWATFRIQDLSSALGLTALALITSLVYNSITVVASGCHIWRQPIDRSLLQCVHRCQSVKGGTSSGGSKNFEKGGGRQFISSVLIYRKCAQRNICRLHGKSGFLTRIWAIGGGRPPPPPLPLNPPLGTSRNLWRCLDVSRSHTFHCPTDLISFDMCRSGPVLFLNGSMVATGVGTGGNREVGLRDRLPKRSSSP